MKTFQIIIALCFFQQSIAQNSFFETLKKNGKDAVYQEYWSVNKNDKGKYEISGKRYEVTAKPVFHKGLTSGFNLMKLEDGKSLKGFNVAKNDYDEIIGYPNISYFLFNRDNSGFVAIEDYIIELKGISKDRLSFNDIGVIFIRKGSGNNVKEGEKKKKKKGKFFKKLGKTTLKVIAKVDVSQLPDKDVKKALSLDLETYIKDYLKAMKSKQNKYTLTAKDKSEISILNQSIHQYNAMVKRKNDSLWNTDEYRRGREMKRRADGVGKRNNVTLINKTGENLLIINSETNTSTMSLGSVSKTWSCSRNAYIGRKSSNCNGGSICYKIIRKVYTANSKCGGTVTIN